MKQSKTIIRLAMMLIVTLISSYAQAQRSNVSPKDEEDQALHFDIYTIGAQFWAESPDTKIYNRKGEGIALKELGGWGRLQYVPTVNAPKLKLIDHAA